MLKANYLLAVLVVSLVSVSCSRDSYISRTLPQAEPSPTVVHPLPDSASLELKQLLASASAQTEVTTGYDPAYVGIDYPNGDVPIETGVCSDVVVRAFRKAGIDLQKEVHEDMKRAWSEYPNKWGARGTDSNIDHRRVLNLTTYFTRQNKSLPVTNAPADYRPGDIVSWDLGNGIDHIGIVTNVWSEPTRRYLIAHNIGSGARIQDVLFAWEITGHYRYFESLNATPLG